jgi:arsenate reductase-like glutaredoxin family protein
VNTKGSDGSVVTKTFTSPTTVTKTSEIHIIDSNGKPMNPNEINRMLNKIPACPVSAVRMKCDFSALLLTDNKEIGLSSKQRKSIQAIYADSDKKIKKLRETAENESKRLTEMILSKATQKQVNAQVIKSVLTDKQFAKLAKLSAKTSTIQMHTSGGKVIHKTSKK